MENKILRYEVQYCGWTWTYALYRVYEIRGNIRRRCVKVNGHSTIVALAEKYNAQLNKRNLKND